MSTAGLVVSPQQADAASVAALRPLGMLTRDASLIERARDQIRVQLDSGNFALAVVAAKLGTSERTLRRRLRELGTGYRELIDAVRRERALRLAHEGLHNVSSMAQQVGFADVTTFTRAFRRWTGTLPSRYVSDVRARNERVGSESGVVPVASIDESDTSVSALASE